MKERLVFVRGDGTRVEQSGGCVFYRPDLEKRCRMQSAVKCRVDTDGIPPNCPLRFVLTIFVEEYE